MLKSYAAAALIALAVPMAASATTYDAYTSFNGTNPAGNFSYYSAGTLLTAPAGDCVSGLTGITCLQTSAGFNGAGFYKSQDNPGQLFVSPDTGNPTTGAGVLFTAPTNGTYSVYGLFNAADDQANGISITWFRSLSGVNSSGGVGPLDSIPSNRTFTQTVTMGAGDTFAFLFGPGSINSNDLTAFNFTVSDAVPEPATWMTMLLGFGLIGMALRRRPSSTAARA